MSCKWELILQALLPLTGGAFDVYLTEPGSSEYRKLAGPPSDACLAVKLALTPTGLKPFETERPVDELKGRAEAISGIEALKLVSRTGPFYGYYLEIRQSGGGA